MYSELLRYSGNRAYAELVLSADLFEQLHLRSPIQRVPPSRADACIRVPIRLEGGPKQNAELDQIRIPKSTCSTFQKLDCTGRISPTEESEHFTASRARRYSHTFIVPPFS